MKKNFSGERPLKRAFVGGGGGAVLRIAWNYSITVGIWIRKLSLYKGILATSGGKVILRSEIPNLKFLHYLNVIPSKEGAEAKKSKVEEIQF